MGDNTTVSVKKEFGVSLDIARSISNREFTVVEGDTGNVLKITLNNDGAPVDLTGCRVMALFSKSDGTTVCQDSGEAGSGVSVGGTNNNEITIALFASSVSPGMVECEIQVYSGSGQETLITTAQFNFKCRRGILNADTVAAVPQYPILVSLIRDMNEIEASTENLIESNISIQAAEEKRVLAETQRSNAENTRNSNEAERKQAEMERDASEKVRANKFNQKERELDELMDTASGLIAELQGAGEGSTPIRSIVGILKGDGTEISAAQSGVDYEAPAAEASALPESGTALSEDTVYTPTSAVGTYQFVPPASGWAHGSFTTAENAAVTFAGGSRFLGQAPERAAGKTYEFDGLDCVWAIQEVSG